MYHMIKKYIDELLGINDVSHDPKNIDELLEVGTRSRPHCRRSPWCPCKNPPSPFLMWKIMIALEQ